MQLRHGRIVIGSLALAAWGCTPEPTGEGIGPHADHGRETPDAASRDEAPADDAGAVDSPVPPDTREIDLDGDGFSVATGDCDESEPNINPAAFEVADNGRDDDCDGAVDELDDCDCGDYPLLPEGLGLCDPRFLLSWEERFVAPGAETGAAVLWRFGADGNGLDVRQGCAYSMLATGPVDIGLCEPTFCPDGHRQGGTDYYHAAGRGYCEDGPGEGDPAPGGPDGAVVCDQHQLVLTLRVPANANGFSFDFLYMSAEYPEWCGQGFNDTFYAILDRPSVGEWLNISYDDAGHEIEVDNAFFENPPVADLSGTGYDGMCFNEDFSTTVCGSSTGWLRTSWGVNPNEEFTLILTIHDEGDGLYDSGVLLDNFQWSPNPVEPGTIII